PPRIAPSLSSGGAMFHGVVGRIGFAGVFLALALAGCAPQAKAPVVDAKASDEEAERQRELTVQDSIDQQKRLFAVSYKLLTANTELCKDRIQYTTGFYSLRPTMFGKDFKAAAGRVLKVEDKYFKVVALSEGSPAVQAGVKVGDAIKL